VNGWMRIGSIDDVPLLEGRAVTVGDRRLAVFRLGDGSFAAVDGACPHAGGPLGDGIVADSCVTCPLHNRRFDLRSGLALNGPERVDVHEVAVRGGELWLKLAGALPAAA
jgi:nitrite reductase (NADH) small subunit